MKRILLLAFIFFTILLFFNLPAKADCEGDFNCDGAVDGADLAEFAEEFGQTECPIKTVKYIICWGLLSTRGRWCDNQNGTITDMTTGLVWLKIANWLGEHVWMDSDYDDAHTWTGILRDPLAGLSDKSVTGDWRLPTKSELVGITQGREAVSNTTPFWFTGVLPGVYWSSTTHDAAPEYAWHVHMGTGVVSFSWKLDSNLILPVHSSK